MKQKICLIAIPLLLFTFLTIFMTWPLTLEMPHSVVGHVGDNFYFVWMVQWFQDALFKYHQSPYFAPQLNFPEGFPLAYNDLTPAMVLLALPFSFIGGPVFGYNMAMFLSFVLSAFGVYWMIYRLTGEKIGGIIAGIIFAFAPYRMNHLLGHLNLMGTQWLPFYFLYLYELLKAEKTSWKRIFKPASFLALIAFTSQYYLAMTFFVSGAFIFFFLLLNGTKSAIASFKKVALMGLAAFPAVFLSILPYLALTLKGELPQYSFLNVSLWSASPTDFIFPSHLHFIWGDWIKKYNNTSYWVESTLYTGIVALILALFAFSRRRNFPPEQTKIIRILFYTSMITIILALGTNLHWMGKSVYIKSYPVLLPGYLLFKYIPFYANMRVWMRYGVYLNLFIAVLAGLGVNELMKSLKGKSREIILGVVLVILVLVDFHQAGFTFSRVKGRPVDYWLAHQRKPGAAVYFPLVNLRRPENVYYTSIHKKPYIGVMGHAYLPPQMRRIEPFLKSFPNTQSIRLLRGLGVRYFIVDGRYYNDMPQIIAALKQMGVRLKNQIESFYVFYDENKQW